MVKLKSLFLSVIMFLFLCVSSVADIKSDPVVDKIPSLKIDEKRTIVLYEAITSDTAKLFQTKFKQFSEESADQPVYIVINSPGGEVISTVDILNTMDKFNGQIICIGDGTVASGAAFIIAQCDKRYAQEDTIIMLHEASISLGGKETELISMLRILIKTTTKLYKQTAAAMGMDYNYFRTKIRSDWWMTPEEGVMNGLLDGIIIEKPEYKIPAPPMPLQFFPYMP